MTSKQSAAVTETKRFMVARNGQVPIAEFDQGTNRVLHYRALQDARNLFVIAIDAKGGSTTSMIWHDEKRS